MVGPLVICSPSVTERRLWLFTLWDLSLVRNWPFRMSWHNLSLLFTGPIVGPVGGGFIAQTIGIKWVFLIIAREYLISLSEVFDFMVCYSGLRSRLTFWDSTSEGNLRSRDLPTSGSKS